MLSLNGPEKLSFAISEPPVIFSSKDDSETSRPVGSSSSPLIIISTFRGRDDRSKVASLEILMVFSVLLFSSSLPENAPCPIVVTLSGITILVSRLPENAFRPIVVTLSGIATLVNRLSENAPWLIVATLSGRVMLVS